jgi:hypothetical protein
MKTKNIRLVSTQRRSSTLYKTKTDTTSLQTKSKRARGDAAAVAEEISTDLCDDLKARLLGEKKIEKRFH